MTNEVLLIDCMEYMADIPDGFFELAIVDPPYRDPEDNQPTKDMRKNGDIHKIGCKYTESQYLETCRVSRNQIIWGANNYYFLPAYKGFVIWEKLTISDKFTMSMAELAYITEGLGTVSKIFKHAPQRSKNDPAIHPNQKPIALYKWLLKLYAKLNDKILDTHIGSGSIRIACHDMGFDLYGCELDADYWKAQEDRFNRHIQQDELFNFEGGNIQ